MNPDEICADADPMKIKVVIRELDEDAFLIEGTADTLRFIAQLLLAVADDEESDGFQISPSGAGGVFFHSRSTHGIYIHRLKNDNIT